MDSKVDKGEIETLKLLWQKLCSALHSGAVFHHSVFLAVTQDICMGYFPNSVDYLAHLPGQQPGYCGSNIQASTFAIIPGTNGCLANVSIQGVASSCALANILAGILH